MTHTWTDDPLCLDAEAVGYREGALDPASEWTLGHGAAFDLARREPMAEASRHVIAVTLAERPLPDAGAARWWRHTEVRDARGSAPRERERLCHAYAADERYIFPAPLHSEAVPRREWTPRLPAWRRPEGVGSTGRYVVVAVIDDAVNVVHERFRYGTTRSRVDFAWVQDGAHATAERVHGGPLHARPGDDTSGVPFGRELVRDDIEPMLPLEEDDALRRLGLLDFCGDGAPALGRRATHGTHVLDVAAGAEPTDAEAARTRIITVSLPRLVTRDTSGQQLCAFFLAALEYVLHRTRLIARALGEPIPLVVNFSYGAAAGPHDGSHPIEGAIDRLLTEHRGAPDGGPAEVVLPSGNRNLARGFAASAPAAASEEEVTLELPWFVPPGDATSSFLEIWLPQHASPLVRVAPPGEPASEVHPQAMPQVLRRPSDSNGASVIARVTIDRPPVWEGTQDVQRRILIALAPTAPTTERRDKAPSGVWTVTVSAKLRGGERINAWIQRDESPIGHRTGSRQSRFEAPSYRRFDARGHVLDEDPATTDTVTVRRAGAINGIATGRCPVVAGGYVHGGGTARMAPYSGTAASGIRQPNIAAVCDRSGLRGGVRGAASRSGTVIALNGTSVAAPHVTRYLAEALGKTPDPSVFDAVAHLRTLLRMPGATPQFWPSLARGGEGALPPHPKLKARTT